MQIPFLKFTKVFYAVFLIIAIICAVMIFMFGLNLGIDFLGGSILELSFEQRPSNQQISEKLNNLELGDLVIQPRGINEVVIKTKEINSETHKKIISQLEELSPLTENSFENIGPVIGKEIKDKTILLIFVCLIALLLYISIAFYKVQKPLSSWQYGLISVATLAFDILVVLGVLAFLGKQYNVQFSIPIITALLTIIGYTMNDKVVVFDRVRENLVKSHQDDFLTIVEKSLNETIMRSISTGACTLFVLFAIFFWGGETLKYFALVLIVGIIIGTFSSLFLAAPMLVTWYKASLKRRG
jgi:preprotein translocase subunit SecF